MQWVNKLWLRSFPGKYRGYMTVRHSDRAFPFLIDSLFKGPMFLYTGYRKAQSTEEWSLLFYFAYCRKVIVHLYWLVESKC